MVKKYTAIFRPQWFKNHSLGATHPYIEEVTELPHAHKKNPYNSISGESFS